MLLLHVQYTYPAPAAVGLWPPHLSPGVFRAAAGPPPPVRGCRLHGSVEMSSIGGGRHEGTYRRKVLRPEDIFRVAVVRFGFRDFAPFSLWGGGGGET